MKLEVYLHFNGNAEEALNFYKTCLGGEITYLQRFGDGPMQVPENHKQKVIHSNLKFGDNMLMISDSMPDNPMNFGNNISLSLGMTEINEMEALFNKMAEGGKINMPLQNTFWESRFGMLTDKFNVNWMFNCPLKK